jgi:hypothetical protein
MVRLHLQDSRIKRQTCLVDELPIVYAGSAEEAMLAATEWGFEHVPMAAHPMGGYWKKDGVRLFASIDQRHA